MDCKYCLISRTSKQYWDLHPVSNIRLITYYFLPFQAKSVRLLHQPPKRPQGHWILQADLRCPGNLEVFWTWNGVLSMFLRPLQIRVGSSLPFGHHNKTVQETKKSVRIGLRAEYWLMFCLYLTGMLYRSPNTSWTPSVRPTVWTCPGRPSGTILMASSTNASFLSHNSWPQSSVPTRKYKTPRYL